MSIEGEPNTQSTQGHLPDIEKYDVKGEEKFDGAQEIHSKEKDQENAPKTPDSRPAAPDGGTLAWLQVVGSWCLVFNTWGILTIFGLYQAYYERGTIFKQSSSNISWIGSLQSLMAFVLGAVVGPVYDRGYLKVLIACGIFGIVFGHMMLSLSTEYWQILLTQGILVGLGGGCLFVPALSVIQPYFSSRIGLALGIVGTGSSVGCVVYSVIFINLIDRVGFPWTTRAIGFIALGILAIPLQLCRMRFKPPAIRSLFDMSALTDMRYLLCVFGCFLGYSGVQVTLFYIAFSGQANGWLSGNTALYLVPIINAGAILGRFFPNWLADKIGPINVIAPGKYKSHSRSCVPLLTGVLYKGCLILGAVLLCNLAVTGSGGAVCVALIFGMFSGIFVSIPPMLFAAMTEDKTKLGARMGMAYALMGLSVLPGGPGAGGVLQHNHSTLDWKAAWAYAGILPYAAFIVFCILRVWIKGLKLWVKI